MFKRIKDRLFPKTAANPAQALLREAIRQWTVMKDRDAAVATLTLCLERFPALPAAHYNRALIYAELGNDAQAVDDLRHLTVSGPELATQLAALFSVHAAATISIGVGEYQRGHLQEALAFFTRALTFAPADPIAHNNRGLLLRLLGDEAGAAQDLQTAITLRWSGPHVMQDTAGRPPAPGA